MEQIISDWVGSELIDSITHTIIQSVWLGAITSYTNEDAVQHQLLLNKIASTEHVKLKVSDMIQAPVTIGFVKPMILFPVSMLTQLTGDEIESILRHEIAHVIRKDYLINILQTLMEKTDACDVIR